MELSEYRPCITTPIERENPVGERLIDDSLFDFVEDQMMKVGSLSHASVLVFLLAAAVWGFWQWRKLQNYESEQQKEEIFRQDPVKLMEERQEVELNQVITNMRKSLKNKRDFLYSSPWYLVLGLENAGKTSLINRSGQNFTLSSVMRASGQRSENPYSFDWWIGDKAVVR
jgi:type VI secretion system protein ImpL